MFGHANDLGRDCSGATVVRACERLHDIGGTNEHDLQVLVFGESGGNTIEHNGRRIIAAMASTAMVTFSVKGIDEPLSSLW